ncbi:MAG: GAF domain-containing SpoIIE family protein phosphatase [Candidatus Cyclobacteriaceae bacterium M2_1C_046]
MLGSKAIVRLSGVIALLAWLILIITDTIILFGEVNQLDSGINPRMPIIALTIFIISLFLFYRYKINKAESVNFVDLLWSVFATGLLATVVSLVFRLLFFLLGDTKLATNPLLVNVVYLINLSLFASFLIHTFIVWKRLILYQKSKFLLRAWSTFEYLLLISVAINVFYKELAEIAPFIFNYYYVALILLGIFLSVNLKWVAYLSFRQKWKGILLIGLALFYLGYFTWTIVSLGIELDDFNISFINFRNHVFLLSTSTFILIYAIFSLLVILFNLPTTSVFEQKLEEVMNFQRLSQSIQTEQSEDRVYDILLDSAVSTVYADAAWLEIDRSGGYDYYTYNVDRKEIDTVKESVTKNRVKGIFDQGTDKTLHMEKYLSSINGSRFKSIMSYPLAVKGGQLGTLVLLKEVTDGFNKEMTQIIRTFTNQAAISIENFRLLAEALHNERYKEELKIAKRVQESLLPDELHNEEHYNIIALSEAADEVGGDYYDTYHISESKTAIIIGDVSGKGTSAAFNMSQMKGVFHSLVQLDLEPVDFLTKANKALGYCLEKSSFITATYFIVDKDKGEVRFARAGHCPTLFYDGKKKRAEFFQNKGLGLGILRNGEFSDYLEMSVLKYKPGDILVLYTDGIVEAVNKKRELFGYDRLKNALAGVAEKNVQDIKAHLLSVLYEFTGNERIDDDYTLLIIKFK